MGSLNMMRRLRFTSHLRFLFVIAVVIPCALLAIMAIRSINREEVFIEKRYQNTLLAETNYVASLINSELGNIRDELNSTSPALQKIAPEDAFSTWRERSPLVNVPFLLSADYEILWPRLAQTASEADLAFLSWNRDFITNETQIPVYQNIALAYKTQIIESDKEAPPSEGLPPGPQEASQQDRLRLGEQTKTDSKPGAKTHIETQTKTQIQAKPETELKNFEKVEAREEEPATVAPLLARQTAPKPEDRVKGKDLDTKAVEDQKVLSEFEKSQSLRQQVYKQAREAGQQTSQRNVMPSASIPDPSQMLQQESIFISEPRRFGEIISGKEYGIIPRFIEDRLTLLFWKRNEMDRIVGCLIDEDVFKNRIISLLPVVYSEARVLTVLDENGRPLIIPDEDVQRDWRRPFVAREISELLPRWEAAAYLTDPDVIASRANLTAIVMWTLILVFFISILSGGVFILKTLRIEMDMAQKKTSFVANVSHELKTPLTSIRMFAEMLKERRQPDRKKQEKYLNIMVSETERLTRLINNVLDFSRMEKDKKQYNMKKLDIAFLCEDVLESQRVRLEHNGFKVHFQNDLGTIMLRGDEEALKQAILNLLSNAEKYSGDHKEIEMEISRTEDFFLINIKDRGIGISPQHVKKIFKEFYRVDETLTADVSGSGLGLTIAQKIVSDHGGSIQYFPRDGGGSIFQIKLPFQAARKKT